MSRSSGDHLKWNEVKEGIIEFVASRSEAVPEPDIRKHLVEKYGITDLKNIKKHLSDLQRQPSSCIEKIQPKPGFANRWEIRRIEHVINIMLNFPNIQLKTYEQPLNLAVKRFSPYHFNSLMVNKFRTQLLLSNSFFDTCVKTDPEIVYHRAYELYKHSFDKWGKEYPERKQKILEDMAQGIAVNMFPTIIKERPVGMSNVADLIEWTLERAAKKKKDEELKLTSYWIELNKLNELFEVKKDKEEEWTRYLNQVSKIGERSGMKKDKESESMHDWDLVSKKLLEKSEMKKDEESKLVSYWMDDSDELFEMKLLRHITPVLNETIFELCFQIDIKDGTVSPEEIEFVNETKEMRAYYKANPEIDLFSELQAYDNFYVQYFEKFRAKT